MRGTEKVRDKEKEPAGEELGTRTSSSPGPRRCRFPILNINGYKIANPTVPFPHPHEELEDRFVGYGYTTVLRGRSTTRQRLKSGSRRPDEASTRSAPQSEEGPQSPDQTRAAAAGWKMIVAPAPRRGGTNTKEVDGHTKGRDFWRRTRLPIRDVVDNPETPEDPRLLDAEYEPGERKEEAFDKYGRLVRRAAGTWQKRETRIQREPARPKAGET